MYGSSEISQKTSRNTEAFRDNGLVNNLFVKGWQRVRRAKQYQALRWRVRGEWHALRARSMAASDHERLVSPGLTVTGFISAESGLGEAARGILRSLDAARIPYNVRNVDFGPARRMVGAHPSSEKLLGSHLLVINPDWILPALREIDREEWKGQYKIGQWSWELEKVPSYFRPLSALFDELWAPSEFAASTLRTISTVPVYCIPHCISCSPDARFDRTYFHLPTNRFLFLFVFDWMSGFERKNPLAVIRAFTSAFPEPSSASLILKCINADEMSAEFQDFLREAALHPDIHIMNGYMPREEVDGLLNCCDCYVSLHRAEGFGMTVAEAMMLGKPVIATDYSATAEFLKAENGFPIGFQLQKVQQSVGPYQKGNRWAEPDTKAAAQVMRALVESPVLGQEKGQKAAETIRSQFSAQRIGLLISEHLQARVRVS